jgi:uncharacterized protein
VRKPIFLSIGYSTCHWCHVMERESFENEAIAALLNRAFRGHQSGSRRTARCGPHLHGVRAGHHRRRRLAHVGMADSRVEAFLRRHLFPPEQRYGHPGFPMVLERVAEAWQQDRDRIEESSRARPSSS